LTADLRARAADGLDKLNQPLNPRIGRRKSDGLPMGFLDYTGG
jgi:hypothetical protein